MDYKPLIDQTAARLAAARLRVADLKTATAEAEREEHSLGGALQVLKELEQMDAAESEAADGDGL